MRPCPGQRKRSQDRWAKSQPNRSTISRRRYSHAMTLRLRSPTAVHNSAELTRNLGITGEGARLVPMVVTMTSVLNATAGLIVRRLCPEAKSDIERLLRRGEIQRLLPGIFVYASHAITWRTWVMAAAAYTSDCVITGDAALAIAFGREARGTVAAFHAHKVRTKSPIQWHSQQVPPQWRVTKGSVT